MSPITQTSAAAEDIAADSGRARAVDVGEFGVGEVGGGVVVSKAEDVETRTMSE